MRDRLGKDLIGKEAIPKLLELFSQCEDLEDAAGLKHLFTIFKGMRLARGDWWGSGETWLCPLGQAITGFVPICRNRKASFSIAKSIPIHHKFEEILTGIVVVIVSLRAWPL